MTTPLRFRMASVDFDETLVFAADSPEAAEAAYPRPKYVVEPEPDHAASGELSPEAVAAALTAMKRHGFRRWEAAVAGISGGKISGFVFNASDPEPGSWYYDHDGPDAILTETDEYAARGVAERYLRRKARGVIEVDP